MARTTDNTILRMFALTATETRASTRILTKDQCLYAAFDCYVSHMNSRYRGERTPLEYARACYEAKGLGVGELVSMPSRAGIQRAWRAALASGIISKVGSRRLRNGHTQPLYRFNDQAELPAR